MIPLRVPPDACATGIALANLMDWLALRRVRRRNQPYHEFNDVNAKFFIHHSYQHDTRLSKSWQDVEERNIEPDVALEK